MLSVKSQAEEPEEVDDAERAESDKDPICVDPDDPNEQDDDCPIIYNMGANSEMVLNKGVSAFWCGFWDDNFLVVQCTLYTMSPGCKGVRV